MIRPSLLDDLAGLPGWFAQASCTGKVSTVADDVWFPEGPDAAAMIQRARAVCQGCAVRSPCLDLALAEGHVDGVWGGLSANERAAIKRDRAA